MSDQKTPRYHVESGETGSGYTLYGVYDGKSHIMAEFYDVYKYNTEDDRFEIINACGFTHAQIFCQILNVQHEALHAQ
ncbi:MAG: hypothetical protein ACOYM3_01240 [Terrimicrobiaceae bacterium]